MLKEELISRKDAAALLGVCVATLRNWKITGKAVPNRIRLGGRIYYKRSEILAFIESCSENG